MTLFKTTTFFSSNQSDGKLVNPIYRMGSMELKISDIAPNPSKTGKVKSSNLLQPDRETFPCSEDHSAVMSHLSAQLVLVRGGQEKAGGGRLPLHDPANMFPQNPKKLGRKKNPVLRQASHTEDVILPLWQPRGRGSQDSCC